MKKTLIIALASLCLGVSAYAQSGKLYPSDETVDIIVDDIKGKYRLEEDPEYKLGFDLDLVFPMYFGWSSLSQGTYSGPGQTFYTTNGRFMDTKMGRNFSFAMDLARVTYAFDENTKVYAGIRYTSDSYSLNNPNVYLDRDLNDRLMPYIQYDKMKKSKFGAHYWGIPVGISYSIGHFTVGGNVAAEFMTKSWSKYKGEDVSWKRENLPGFRKFRLSFTLSAAVCGTGMFLRLTPMPVFEDKVLYDGATPLTFGFAIGL